MGIIFSSVETAITDFDFSTPPTFTKPWAGIVGGIILGGVIGNSVVMMTDDALETGKDDSSERN